MILAVMFHFRVLFPDLHDEDFVLLSNETVDGIAEMPVNSMSLLHPLLLPRLYPPLFTLYALQTEKTDALYMEKLYYLNKRGDIALMSFLGIKRYLANCQGKVNLIRIQFIDLMYHIL